MKGMRIAIAGAGAVGRSVARELLDNGHKVLLIERDPTKYEPQTVPDADWFLADEAQRSARCPVCHGRKEDDMGGWCVGCGGIGVVPQ